MVSMSGALMAKKEVLEPFLSLILRDDLLSWHVSKAPVNRTEEQQKAVSNMLLASWSIVWRQYRCCYPSCSGDSQTFALFFRSLWPERKHVKDAPDTRF